MEDDQSNSARGPDSPPPACSALEAWRAESKDHAIEISVGNGYGASCWEVTLFKGKTKLVCCEVAFFEGPTERQMGDDLYVVVPEQEDWPGLDATIHHALAKAREFWPNDQAQATGH